MAKVRNYDRINKFVQHAIDIANDNSHGYAQDSRWGPDYDCSSLMYECAYYAGYNVKRANPRYTGAMLDDFRAVGYRADAFDGILSDLEKGDILLNTAYHTAVYIGNGQIVEASINEKGGVSGGTPGDQTGHEIHIRSVYNYPWTHVLTPPEDWTEESSPTPAPQNDTNTKLNGIDIASYQAGINAGGIAGDFVIVKTTEGTTYTNPYAREQLASAKSGGKKLGIYHFASGGDANAEAQYFVNSLGEYKGQAVLVLDWEASAVSRGVGWAKTWLDRVYQLTGIKPLIYMSNSIVNGYDWSSVANAGYELWNAGYYKGYEVFNGYFPDAPLIGGTGAWKKATIYQYTSSGRLSGWNANLDFDVFYGNKSDWDRLAGGSSSKEDEVTNEDIQKIIEGVWSYKIKDVQARDRLYGMDSLQIPAIPEKVWSYQINKTQARDRLYGMDAIQLPAILAAATAIADGLAKDKNADEVAKAVQKAVKEALEKIELNVNVKK